MTDDAQSLASRVLHDTTRPAGPVVVIGRSWVVRGDTGTAGAVSWQTGDDSAMGGEHVVPGVPTHKYLFVVDSAESTITHALPDTSPYLIFEMAVAPLVVHHTPMLVMRCGYPATDHIFERVFYFSQGVAREAPLGYIPADALSGTRHNTASAPCSSATAP